MKKTSLRSSSGNKIDFWAFVLYVFLLAIGFLNIYSVTSDVNQSTFHLSQIATKQLIWIGGAGLIILSIIFPFALKSQFY